jgi:hypothetical protein
MKDIVASVGIAATLVVSAANFIYTLRNNRRSSFINTVTTSRLKWIDSLRDKVAEYIAITSRLLIEKGNKGDICLHRDMLLHQIVLHLNPLDPEDERIKALAEHLKELTDHAATIEESNNGLTELRNATGRYLKKEWTRVKKESGGRDSKANLPH